MTITTRYLLISVCALWQSFPQAARLCKIMSQETLSEHCVQAAYRDASEHDNITGWEVFIGGCRAAGVKTLLMLAT